MWWQKYWSVSSIIRTLRIMTMNFVFFLWPPWSREEWFELECHLEKGYKYHSKKLGGLWYHACLSNYARPGHWRNGGAFVSKHHWGRRRRGVFILLREIFFPQDIPSSMIFHETLHSLWVVCTQLILKIFYLFFLLMRWRWLWDAAENGKFDFGTFRMFYLLPFQSVNSVLIFSGLNLKFCLEEMITQTFPFLPTIYQFALQSPI